jgi:soluble calcium-activated nucleotidase 1
MEGDGANSKGFKTEWSTVKDGLLYIGSFGKEYTHNDGTVKNRNNLWVKTISPNGIVTHIDWTLMYEQLRKATNTQFPGYMIIEAVEWSHVHKRWYILPRRVSSESYDDMKDEKRGSNIMLVANEDFTDVVVSKIGTLTPERGYSAFKFVPGTNDNVIIALKSAENDVAGTQETFVSVFTVDGRMLLEEELMGHSKFEGLAFI